MLDVAAAKLTQTGLPNWAVKVADNRRLPLSSRVADVSIAGWSLGHFTGWYKETWRIEIGRALAEMKRVLRAGGTILFESLGTGNESPVRLEHVESTYRWLDANGFQNKWIRTDYQFQSVEEAVEMAGFLFGEEVAGQVEERRSVILPECTGVWWRRV